MKTLDNIKLTELSTEEKMNVNGGGALGKLAKWIIKTVAAELAEEAVRYPEGPTDDNPVNDYDAWTKATS